MKLFISGKGEFLVRNLRPSIIKAKKLLDDSKDGELFSSTQLARVVGVFHSYFSHSADDLPSYSHRVGVTRYWGKPATIKQLIKESK